MKNSDQKIVVPVCGLHCKSCELIIEDSLSEIKGVKKTSASFANSEVEICYDGKAPSAEEIARVIKQAGYKVGREDEQFKFISRDKKIYLDFGLSLLVLAALYFILKVVGLNNLNFNTTGAGLGVGVILLIGLTAGFSTCMALVGGLVLGVSAKHSEAHPEAKPLSKLKPHLFFNLGRILGYAVLGGLLGLIGSALKLSGTTLGIIILIAGLFMLIMGLQLIDIFPWADRIKITLPKALSRFLKIDNKNKKYSDVSTLILGALTFFLPCGFTQAMQVYAVSTGSFWLGGAAMGLFALGTAPGIFGVGTLAALAKGRFAKFFFRFAGLAVIVFAILNIQSGLVLTGLDFKSASSEIVSNDPNVTVEDGVQIVKMKETSRGYEPNNFTIVKGLPVKWVITSEDQYSCASDLIMKKYNIRRTLKSGENIIEFTPTETGLLKFSCSMGMYTGAFNVIDKNTAPNENLFKTDSQVDYGNASVDNKKQIISSVFTLKDDISPNTFTVKVNEPVRYTIAVKEDGLGCMYNIKIPELYEKPIRLLAGKQIVMEFTPTEVGQYPITCGMGMQRGLLIVE
ncbi:MAG: sulfite exporter TauE/SafE family protein [Patescibacteria group bacterium]